MEFVSIQGGKRDEEKRPRGGGVKARGRTRQGRRGGKGFSLSTKGRPFFRGQVTSQLHNPILMHEN